MVNSFSTRYASRGQVEFLQVPMQKPGRVLAQHPRLFRRVPVCSTQVGFRKLWVQHGHHLRVLVLSCHESRVSIVIRAIKSMNIVQMILNISNTTSLCMAGTGNNAEACCWGKHLSVFFMSREKVWQFQIEACARPLEVGIQSRVSCVRATSNNQPETRNRCLQRMQTSCFTAGSLLGFCSNMMVLATIHKPALFVGDWKKALLVCHLWTNPWRVIILRPLVPYKAVAARWRKFPE